ncbi:MAG: oligopeptide ABC transporter ATP-binding protein, partial [Thermoprotei archaeon]
GETGCGKTTTGRMILGLEKPTEGRIFFEDVEITALPEKEMRRLRRKIQPIFQDPYASLNPRMKIGEAVKHPLEIHGIAEGEEARKMVLEMLEKVGLTPAEKFYNLYPKDLSGGQRQRVAIARAMILKPEFVVADEPVSMVDVSLKAAILELMLKFKEELGLTYLLITHDLAIARYVTDRIAIMYLGKIVEMGPADEVFENPMHPYTRALIKAIPAPKPVKEKKIPIRGEVPPSPVDIPSGCRFHTRCPLATEECKAKKPELVKVGPDHYVACLKV